MLLILLLFVSFRIPFFQTSATFSSLMVAREVFLIFDDNDDSDRVDARDTLMMLMSNIYNWKSRGPRGPDFKLEALHLQFLRCLVWLMKSSLIMIIIMTNECKQIEKICGWMENWLSHFPIAVQSLIIVQSLILVQLQDDPVQSTQC